MSTARLVMLGILVLATRLTHWHGVRAAKDCSNYTILDNDPLPCDVKHEILRVHNTLRQQLAKGLVAKQPPASNMCEMYWDEELARGAQQWANHCTFEHNSNKDREVARFPVGQNLGITRTKGQVKGENRIDFPKHINAWFDEHKLYTYSPIGTYQRTGHYTQVAWATTFLVGCGYIRYKDSKNITNRFYVCNYGPAGNIKKNKPYTVGRKLKCGVNFQKSSTYDGLCSMKHTPKDPCSLEEEDSDGETEKNDEAVTLKYDNTNIDPNVDDIQERQWNEGILQKNNIMVQPKNETEELYKIKAQVSQKANTEALQEIETEVLNRPEIDIINTIEPEISYKNKKMVLNKKQTGVPLERVTEGLHKAKIKDPYKTETDVPYEMKLKIPNESKTEILDEPQMEGLGETFNEGDVEDDCSEGYCITTKVVKKVEIMKDNETTTNPYLKKIYNLITINIYH